MRSIEWCYFQWPWVTPNVDFKIMTFFNLKLENGARYSCTYNDWIWEWRIESCHFQWPPHPLLNSSRHHPHSRHPSLFHSILEIPSTVDFFYLLHCLTIMGLDRTYQACTLYLVSGVSFPLSVEAVIKFGPMHIPIATKVTRTSLASSCEPQKSRWFHLMQFWRLH